LKRKNSCRFFIIIAVCTLLLAFSGCGKKADPRFSGPSLPGVVSNLSASPEGNSVKLSWSMPVKGADSDRVRLLRNGTSLDENECPGCPRAYTLMAELSFQDSRLVRDGKGNFTYLDSSVNKGFQYFYKIVICSSSAVCGEESNVADIAFE
jgi:hypothetical protein